MVNRLTLNDVAEFSWNYCAEFFLETDVGNYIWSNPEYGGTNTIRSYDGALDRYIKEHGLPYVRDKGRHVIRDYCGEDVKFI